MAKPIPTNRFRQISRSHCSENEPRHQDWRLLRTAQQSAGWITPRRLWNPDNQHCLTRTHAHAPSTPSPRHEHRQPEHPSRTRTRDGEPTDPGPHHRRVWRTYYRTPSAHRRPCVRLLPNATRLHHRHDALTSCCPAASLCFAQFSHRNPRQLPTLSLALPPRFALPSLKEWAKADDGDQLYSFKVEHAYVVPPSCLPRLLRRGCRL